MQPGHAVGGEQDSGEPAKNHKRLVNAGLAMDLGAG
jgi:hypothetical protein